MYSRNSFGSYYPIDSCIHRLNPIMKLFSFIIMIVVLILTNSLNVNVFSLLLVFIMALLSFVPFKYYFNTFWALRYVYLVIAFICAYIGTTLQTGVVYIIKLVCVVEYLNILAYTTSPSESIYGIERFLSLFNFLYLPVARVATKINSLLRYIPLLLAVEYKALKAASSRGVDYAHSNIITRIGVLFKIHSNRRRLTKYRNKETAFASSLRLYDIRKYRTNYRTNKVGFYDLFFLLLHLALLFAFLAEIGAIAI